VESTGSMGMRGFCQASFQIEISSYHPHVGEEKAIVGKGGSGTVSLSNCCFRSVFCINSEISQEGIGKPRSIEDIAEMMLHLLEMGCHNINLLTQTHYFPHIVLAVNVAAGKRFWLPLVYNTCGWERLEIVKRLDRRIDT